MAKITQRLVSFTNPEFPESYNPSMVKFAFSACNFVVGFLLLSALLGMIVWSLTYDYTQTTNSGREILVDSGGNWFEIHNSTLHQIDDTNLKIGDEITYTFTGEISDVEYSSTYCDQDSLDGTEQCWTSYSTYYRFLFLNTTIETSAKSIHDFYFCHRNVCQITMQVINLSNIPDVIILQAEEVVM